MLNVEEMLQRIAKGIELHSNALRSYGLNDAAIEAAIMAQYGLNDVMPQRRQKRPPSAEPKAPNCKARHPQILDNLDSDGLTTKQIVDVTGLSKQIVLAELKALIEDAQVEKLGDKRSTIWRLAR